MLHKSGCDPDFSYTKRFEIDVEPLIDHLVDKGQIEDSHISRTSLGNLFKDGTINSFYFDIFICSIDSKFRSGNHRETGIGGQTQPGATES